MRFAEGLTPLAIETDYLGHARAIRLVREVGGAGEGNQKEEVVLPARAVLIAAGTQHNTVLAREDGRVLLDGKYFAAVDEDGNPVKPQFSISKPVTAHVLMQKRDDGRAISYFGDLHQSFFRNVVKAMGERAAGLPRG